MKLFLDGTVCMQFDRTTLIY